MRINLRDVPDDIYTTLVEKAEARHQSLNAYVIDRPAEAVEGARPADHVASYAPPTGTGISLEDAAAAVRDVRKAS